MSNPDSFIDEVTEEVRRDKLYALLKRYGWIGIVAVLALVGGAAWHEYSQSQKRVQAQALGDEVLGALDAETPEARVAQLSAIDAPTPQTRAVVAMLLAADAAQDGAPDTAAQALESVTVDGELPEIYREIATWKAMTLQDSPLSLEDRRAGLEGLAVPGKPLRLLAEEQLALLDIEAGSTDAALERLRRILEDSEITAGLRQRASQLIVALGGTPNDE
ncbi:tetratricopeptide repeat protein [Citreicella sp. C3M06]|uniref:tetratricopeptide repeat protein n=1 Tax=Citreicella sp. C3M06 TaxID=2841564 RepID=UPI001C085FFF|nr:tetratricopeptide repeat protein [Citreicella sp. C3M06]MBU2962634.1 tetratricopeptide repeat protein [Citreicella sp. C3M06]